VDRYLLVTDLRARLGQVNADITESGTFQAQALSRFTAEHDETTALRKELESATDAKVRTLRAAPHSRAR